MHLGMIGGIGPGATVFYYEHLTQAFAAAGQTLHLTIGHTSALMLSRNVAGGHAQAQAAEFNRIGVQLAAAGAEAIVIASMGGHFCAREFAAMSALPIIDGPTAVAQALRQRGISKVGLLGTRVVMETDLYGALSDLHPIAPKGPQLAQVNDDYVAVAIAGTALPEEGRRLIAAGTQLVEDYGAEAVLLGGTDLNLVYADANLNFPVIDSALLHVEAVVAAALSG